MRGNEDITNTVRQHSDTVARVCSLYFGGRPERDDAFQEAFIKYAQSDKAFADDEHVKAWLINVAANACKDMLRRADAKTVLIDEFDDNAQPGWNSANPGGGDPTSGLSGAGGGRIGELNEALQKLDDKYRIALYLKYYEGYTAAEIARVLEIPENTVYTNLARGRKELKEVLAND